MENLVDWSSLLPELVVEIAGRMQSVEDFTAFRGVCTPWRAATPKTAFGSKPGSGSVPLLMFSGSESAERQLFSVSKRKVLGTLHLPEATAKMCIGARFGWILTVGENSGEVSLLNPFSRAQIELPHFTTLPISEVLPSVSFYWCVTRAILSADPSDNPDSYVLIVITFDWLCFWRPGNEKWTFVETPMYDLRPTSFKNLGCCKGEFYAIESGSGNIWALDLHKDHVSAARIIVKFPYHLVGKKMVYLVESSEGELILVTRDGVTHSKGFGVQFEVFKVDVIKGEWEIIHSLGRNAVFVAFNNPFCIQISSSDGDDDGRSIKPNRIYFSDGFTFMQDDFSFLISFGVYHVQDKRSELFYNIDSRTYYFKSLSPPLWVESSLFIKD